MSNKFVKFPGQDSSSHRESFGGVEPCLHLGCLGCTSHHWPFEFRWSPHAVITLTKEESEGTESKEDDGLGSSSSENDQEQLQAPTRAVRWGLSIASFSKTGGAYSAYSFKRTSAVTQALAVPKQWLGTRTQTEDPWHPFTR